MSEPFRPFPYQEYAIQHVLDHPASALLIEMGLGKTVITLTAIEELLYNRFEIKKPLVIAPKRVAESVWVEEAKKWSHTEYLTISKVLGTEKQRIRALQQEADIYVTNRDNVVWLTRYYGNRWPFDFVVLDELSSFKSAKSQRFRALRKIRPLIKRIVGLTGTPAPNGVIDLWAQFYLLDQGERLGKTLTGYREKFFVPGRRNRHIVFNWNPKDGAHEDIYRAIGDISCSMKASDWLQLPEQINRIVSVRLPYHAWEKYQQLERDLLLPCQESDIVAGTAAVLGNKLLQLANGAVYDEFKQVQEIHEAKLEALEDLVEAANGKPVLVFYTYEHDRDRILTRLPARLLKDPKDIEDWNQGKIPVLLAHPASSGHGLNLQYGGNTIIWFSLTYNLEHYLQANARLHRQGQKERVIVYHLVAKDTLDEEVLDVLMGKAEEQNGLMDALKARIRRVKSSPVKVNR